MNHLTQFLVRNLFLIENICLNYLITVQKASSLIK
jgi:hypothetical protein